MRGGSAVGGQDGGGGEGGGRDEGRSRVAEGGGAGLPRG